MRYSLVMPPALKILGVITIAELIIWSPGFWRIRKYWAAACVVAVAAVSGAIIALKPGIWSLLLLVTSAYRIINLLRLIEGRMHEVYLRQRTLKTSLRLIIAQIVVLLVWYAAVHFAWRAQVGWTVVAVLQMITGLIVFIATIRHLRTTRPPKLTEHYPDKDLPTLTVAIPARNETDTLQACLQSVVASNYPKLEVLVLDDCSQDKTPEIIRSFAHDGIRFIAGEEPHDNWLAKNQAYDRLFEVANGELILFCGVDVQFEPDSLRQLVSVMLQKRQSMLGIIPRNVIPGALNKHESVLIQPLRYAWEISLPRWFFRRPPVLSTCWIAKRQLLESAGGFAAVSRTITPESYFAKASMEHDGYSFLQSDTSLGIVSVKSFQDQRDTAIRTRYPQLHRRVELVMLLSLLEFVLLVGSPLLFVASLAMGWWLTAILSGVAFLLEGTTYLLVSRLAYQQLLGRSFLVAPIAILLNIGLLNYSMWQYEFNKVLWKGRNVCLPVMHVIPRLPKI